MTKRKPRKPDTRVTYTPEQTERYKSQLSRYEKGINIARVEVVHKIDDGLYRISSARSPIGYWSITEKPSKGDITVIWEGKKCKKNPPPLNGPDGFTDMEFSGCPPGWTILFAAPRKIIGYDSTFSPITVPCSLDEVISSFRRVFNQSDGTNESILTGSGGTGQIQDFEYGRIYGLIGIGRFCDSGRVAPPFCVPAYFSGAFRVEILTQVPSPQALLDSLSENSSELEIVTMSTFGGGPLPNCDLFKLDNRSDGPPPNCSVGGERITWECTYPLDEQEFSLSWSVASNFSIRNDTGYTKTLAPCPAPEPVGEIKVVGISKVTGTESGGYACTCPDFSREEAAFDPPAYPSMSQKRSWGNSNAGAPVWSDGKRRCCHIVAVQNVRGEDIPTPEDF